MTRSRPSRRLHKRPPSFPTTDVNVKAPYKLNDFDPAIPYVPVPPVIEKLTVGSNVWFNPPEIPIAGPAGHDLSWLPHPAWTRTEHAATERVARSGPA